MFETLASISNTLTLAEVVTRLAEHTEVDGVLLIGSTGRASLSTASDYDLVVILADMPAPLHVALTVVDSRLTDVIFYHTRAIERILTNDDLADSADSIAGKLIRWLQSGQIAFDRTGLLAQAQSRVQDGQWFRLCGDEEVYATWFSVNYNVLQTRRMAVADDPVYRTAVDYRLLYTLADLWLSYFRVRRLVWDGEKAAVRYFTQHDPTYLALFRTCLSEPDMQRKLNMYEELARLTLIPVGGLWPAGATGIQVEAPSNGAPVSPVVTDALAFWEHLLT